MFEQTLTRPEPGGARPLIISFTAQFLLLGIALLIPLIYFEQLPKVNFAAVDLRAPRLTPEVPMEAIRQVVARAAVTALATRKQVRFTAPSVIPRTTPLIDDSGIMIQAEDSRNSPFADGIASVARLDGASALPPPPPVEVPKRPESQPAPVGPQRIGGDVMAAKLIRQVMPAYPPLAKAMRMQGVVKLTASIGKDGAIQNLQLMSGPPLLVKAAMEAVREWRYSPTLLNGQPVEVLTTIEVNFTLSR